jgi:hypothetical protein
MSTKTRTIALAVAALSLVVAAMFPLCALAAGGASTPEGVFNNFKTAMKDKDFKSGFAQLTPDSQDMMLGSLAANISLGFGMDPTKGPDVQKMMDKHGIKKIDPTTIQPGTDPRVLLKDTVANVKDKPACFADLMTWMENNSEGKDRAEKMEAYAHAELVDLKTEGDSAVGSVKVKRNGNEESNPMTFKKIGGTWFIDLAAQAGPAGRAAAPGK